MESKAILAVFPILIIPLAIGSLVTWKSVSWSARWFLGVSFLGIFLVCVHAFGVPQRTVQILLVIALALICILISLHRNDLFKNVRWPTRQTLIILLILFIQLMSAYATILANPVIEWDAVAIWFQKAKAFYYWEPFKSFPIVNYPNFGAAYWAFIMKFTGFTEAMGRLLIPTAYFAFMMVLYSLFKADNTSWTGVFVIPPVSIFFFHNAYVSGYQDGLLSLMAGMSAFYYCRFFILLRSANHVTLCHRDIYYDLFLAVFFSGILGFIKNEGTIIAVLLFFSAAGWFMIQIRSNQVIGKMPLFFSVIMFLVLISLWSLLLLYNGVDPSQVQGGVFSIKGIFNFYKNINRYSDIKQYFSQYLTSHGMIIIVASLLSILSALYAKTTRTTLCFIWTFYVLHFAFVALVFFSTGTNYMWHLGTAFDRLMFQHRFVYILVIVITTSKYMRSRDA
jgi:hypothetical protein